LSLEFLLEGFQKVIGLDCIGWVALGTLLGTAVGVLPGLGPTATLALLLPITYSLPPMESIVFLAGIGYGAMYGGSTTSILMNLPGEAASVVTTFDGYKMAQQGRAGPALCISAIGSFIAGTIGLVGLTFFAPTFADAALTFGAPEYFSLATLGVVMVAYLTGKSRLNGFISATVGLLLATVGQDSISGSERLAFGNPYLLGGFEFASVAMGLFGVGEILYNLGKTQEIQLATNKIERVWLNAADWAQARWAVLRGTIIGFVLGIIPGAGVVMSSILSYTFEKRLSRQPEKFGNGAIEGVAAPESANNAAASSAFIPLLTLGIPPNVVMALLFGAFLMQGIEPGPLLMTEHPDVFWGLIASMYVGNVFLVILNIPLVGLWVQLLRIPFRLLGPLVITITLIGAYTLNNSAFDVWTVISFGILGYVLRKFNIDVGPLVLGFVLGPILERNFRRALIASSGDMMVFLSRPIPLVVLLITLSLIVWEIWKAFKSRNPEPVIKGK